MPAKRTKVPAKKPPTPAVPRGKLIKAKATPAKGKGAVKPKPVKPAEAHPFPGPDSKVKLSPAATWPFPVPLKGEAKEVPQTAISVAPASTHTGHRRLHHGDWKLNINAHPPEGWYHCLCRNEAEGTIGFLVMHYDPFRGHFRRPLGDDAPEELEVIAYTPVPCGAFVNNMLDDFDYYAEGGE